MSDIQKTKLKSTDEILKSLIETEQYTQIGRVASGLAHNLQSPLTAIKGYAQLIQVDHGNIEELDLIVKEVQAVQCVTHHLMTKMRNLQNQSVRPLLINDIIHLELEFLKSHLIFKHKIKKQITFDPELPVINGLYSDFSQMILNLLLNSIDAMVDSPQKNLFIETRHDASFIYIEIKDTGIGISKKDMGKIYEPFFTTKASLTEVEDDKIPTGVGIGLTAVKRLVEKYQGKLNITSDQSGTQVVLKLPYKN